MKIPDLIDKIREPKRTDKPGFSLSIYHLPVRLLHNLAKKSPAVSLGIALSLACSPALSIDSPAAGKSQWACQASTTGEGWQCQRIEASTKTRDQQKLTLTPLNVTPKTNAIAASTPHSGKQSNTKAGILQDWYPAGNTQEDSCCEGKYLEPVRTDADATLSPDEAEIKLSAEETDTDGNVTTLQGNVVMTQGYRQLNSDEIIFDQNLKSVDVDGSVVFREPGFLVTGKTADIDLASGNVLVSNAEFLLHDAHLRGAAASISRQDGVMILDDVSATYCEPEDNSWHLQSHTLTLNNETGVGEARKVKLYVKDVPVAYAPYLSFPIDDRRKSGFLTPSVSHGDDGLDVTVPYYFNLAPNYDATLVSRFIEDRGFLLGGEFRHLSSYFSTRTSAAFLPDDNDADADRWLINALQTGGASQPWYTSVNYTRVSDDDYFRDLSDSGLKVNSATHLLQQASAGYKTEHWHFSGKVEEYQTIDVNSPDPYYQLPALMAEGRYDLPWDVQLDMNNELVMFEHRNQSRNTTGNRLRLEYGISKAFSGQGFYLTPGFKVRHIDQHLDLNPLSPTTRSDASATVPSFTLDSGLLFERDAKLFGDASIQTFEPRLFYYYADYEDQQNLHLFDTDDMTFSYAQLFRDYRFSGGDRIGDANQLSLGLTTRFIDPETGKQQLRFSIGQIFYFEDRIITSTLLPVAAPGYNQTRNHSSIASELEIALNNAWTLNSELIWDANINQIDKGSVGMRYNDGEEHIVNAEYRYINYSKSPRLGLNGLPLAPVQLVERSIDQVDLSSFWRLNAGWSLIGKLNYDFTNSRELETIAGVQYDECCWNVRLIYRQWVDNPFGLDNTSLQQEDSGIFLEFQLTGLGQIGERIGNILDDSIPGYEDRNETR